MTTTAQGSSSMKVGGLGKDDGREKVAHILTAGNWKLHFVFFFCFLRIII